MTNYDNHGMEHYVQLIIVVTTLLAISYKTVVSHIFSLKTHPGTLIAYISYDEKANTYDQAGAGRDKKGHRRLHRHPTL